MDIDLNKIYMFEKKGNYLHIFTESEILVERKSIYKVLVELGGDNFVMIHRSFLVNMTKIKAYYGKNIMLINNQELFISKKYRNHFKNYYMRYLSLKL